MFVCSTFVFIPLFDEKSFFARRVPLCVAFGSCAIGMLLGIMIWRCYRICAPEAAGPSELLDPLKSRHSRRVAGAAALASLAVAGIGLALYLAIESGGSLSGILYIICKYMLHEPGGYFALLTGILTVIGTYMAVHAILEVRQTITSFPQLLDRLTFMLDEEDKDPDLGVCFLAKTPLTGSWNVPKRFSKNLENALCKPTTKVTLACLEFGATKAHEQFLNLFIDKAMPIGKSIKKDDVEAYIKTCTVVEDVITGRIRDPKTAQYKDVNRIGEVIGLGDDQMPDYYFFFSSERAIIVVPVNMPTIRFPFSKLHSFVHVETLGFETTDKRIIATLRHEFDRYAYHKSGGAAQPDQASPAKEQ
jgi:hypothetical protein